MKRGTGRGLNGRDLLVMVLGLAVAWGIAGRHDYSVGSVIFASILTGLFLIGFVRRLLRL
jgi:hypothetical protein